MPFFKKSKKKNKKNKEVLPKEGQLAVDVYENEREIIVVAPISNAKEDDLDIYIEKETVTISGKREVPEEGKDAERIIHQECYWGTFSREIILPEEVDSYSTKASFENGIIKLVMPKMKVAQRKKIVINNKKNDNK